MVKAHFPDLEVEDRLKIVAGVPNKEQWLGAVSFGLKQLAHLKQGSARLLGVGLKVDGEARSAADYTEVKKALAGPLPTGLSIMSDNVRPPMADPFIFTADLGPDGLTLSGSVPSEDGVGALTGTVAAIVLASNGRRPAAACLGRAQELGRRGRRGLAGAEPS